MFLNDTDKYIKEQAMYRIGDFVTYNESQFVITGIEELEGKLTYDIRSNHALYWRVPAKELKKDKVKQV